MIFDNEASPGNHNDFLTVLELSCRDLSSGLANVW